MRIVMVLGAGAHNLGIWGKSQSVEIYEDNTMDEHHNKQVPGSRPSEWLAHKRDKEHTRVIADHQRWAQRQHREFSGQ